jgi:L-cysteine/cystine lyase
MVKPVGQQTTTREHLPRIAGSLGQVSQARGIPHVRAYFQTSGHAPTLEGVVEEVNRWTSVLAVGPAIPELHAEVKEMFEDVRRRVSEAIHAGPDEVMLNENATTGINVVAAGIDWNEGDNVILTSHEHPGNRLPWYNVRRRYGVELRFLDGSARDGRFLDALEQALDDRTRVVSISHVSRESGRRFPAREVADVAHRRDVPVLLDGAQAFGAIPVDVKALDCDFYVLSGHKYIMGPQGTGAFYVRQDRLEWLKPSWIGSHSQRDMDMVGAMTLHDAAKRFEFGTRNMAIQAGFGKALEIWESVGWDRVYGAIEAYTDTMKEALQTIPGVVLETPLPYEESSGIVTARSPGSHDGGLASRLWEEERILVSSIGVDGKSIRVSTHVFNTDEDCSRLVSALQRILVG